jgi:hypothetical protein
MDDYLDKYMNNPLQLGLLSKTSISLLFYTFITGTFADLK